MSSPGDHDLLLKLIQKVDMLYEEFRRVSNGHGFPRCAERLAKLEGVKEELKVLHKRIDSINSKIWWAVTTSLVSLAGMLASLLLKG